MRRTSYAATGTIRNGKLRLANGTRWIEAIRSFPDGPVNVHIERRSATRSLQANRYYFGVVVKTISDYTGYSPDETHQALKALHLPKHLAFADGNGEVVGELVIGGSTRVLNNNDFSDYIRRIRDWSRDTLDLEIPDAES